MSILQDEDIFSCHTNGSVFSGKYLPPEIVSHILIFVPWERLPACRTVCILWKSLIDHEVSKAKLMRQYKSSYFKSCSNQSFLKHKNVPFFLKYAIAQEVFGTNLLSGYFDNKTAIPVMWRATLSNFGLNAKIMDEIQPHLEIFIWYSSYLSTNSIRISLMDDEDECVFYYFCKSANEDCEFQKVFYTFKDYGPGVRYVQFQHGADRATRYCLRSSYKIANLWLLALIPPQLFPGVAEVEEEEEDSQCDAD